METQLIELYTDGSCLGNPGVGGWGVLIIEQGIEVCYSGSEPYTTNNRMELTAVIEGLKKISTISLHKVIITTDSKYVKQGVTEWLPHWVQNGWRNSRKEPVKNRDLWQSLLESKSNHVITWQWVKGHSNHRENGIADHLAREAASKCREVI